MAWFLLPFSQFPLAPLAVSFLLPFVPLSTYLAPSSCDRNRPPPSQVACKLTLFAPPFTQLSRPFQLPRTPTTQRLTTTTLGLLRSCYAEQSLCRLEYWSPKENLSIHRFKSEGFIKFVALSDKMSRKTNHRIALTDKFSIIAAHHWELIKTSVTVRMVPPEDVVETTIHTETWSTVENLCLRWQQQNLPQLIANLSNNFAPVRSRNISPSLKMYSFFCKFKYFCLSVILQFCLFV